MRWHAVAMHQNNGNGADAIIKGGLQPRRYIIKIKRRNNLVTRINAFDHLFNAVIQHFGKDDFLVKQAWPRLIGNAKLVAKPLGHNKQGFVALALKKRVCRHGCSHFHRINGIGWQWRIFGDMHQIAHALQSGIFIGFGIFRQ